MIPIRLRIKLGRPQFYRGFDVSYNEKRPVTGRWRGVRFGVSVNASSYAGLKKVIDNHIKENQRWSK